MNETEAPLSLPSKSEAVHLLWHRGVLSWKLDSCQKEFYNLYYNSNHKIPTWLIARRYGKSHTLCTLAIEQCIKVPYSVVKYVAPNKKMVQTIIKPLIRKLCDDCPKELKPEYKTQEHLYRFPNGSEIQLAGTDAGHADSIRGGEAHLCVVDEAGFCDDLEYVIQSVLLPTLDTTKGKLILSSTPPKSGDHEFIEYIKEAQVKGSFVKKTIYDNTRLTEEDRQEIIDQYIGGVENTTFRREYLCDLLADLDRAVVPEFNEKIKKECVKEWPRPTHFDCYVSADIGVKDFTVVIFAYFDFKHAKIIIEDEIVINGREMNTDGLAALVKEKEESLWTNPLTLEKKPPYIRVCDNELLLIQDLERNHGLIFYPTEKHDRDMAINNLRVAIGQGKIIINPKCKTLIRHLANATWSKNRKGFDRSHDHGHYDALFAAVYLVRNINYGKNPYPSSVHFGDNRMSNPFYKPPVTKMQESIKSWFKPKSSFRNNK